MFDRSQTTEELRYEREIAPGASILHEGLVLVSVDNGSGVEAVKPSVGAAGEVVVGFSENSFIIPSEEVVQVTVKASATGDIALKTNIVAGTVKAVNSTESATYTQAADASAAGTFSVNELTGAVKVHSAGYSDTFVITYRRNLTVLEQQQKFGGRPVNKAASGLFNSIAVKSGKGQIFTDRFVTTDDFVVGGKVYAAANGLLSSVAAGKAAVPGARIISVPTPARPLLGIAYNI